MLTMAYLPVLLDPVAYRGESQSILWIHGWRSDILSSVVHILTLTILSARKSGGFLHSRTPKPRDEKRC